MGKSSERLGEEIAAGMLYDMQPIAEFKLGGVVADTSGMALDLSNARLFNAYFRTTNRHIQVETDEQLSEATRNWEICTINPSAGGTEPGNSGESLSGGAVVLQCTLTGALLTVQTCGRELPSEITQSFSTYAFEQRLRSNLPQDADHPHSHIHAEHWRAQYPGNAWAMAVRIVTDLLITPPAERRNINNGLGKPACLLNLPLLLPFLGFREETDAWIPPRQDAPGSIARLRRILLELQLQTKQLHERLPVLPAAARFLGGARPAETQHLSAPEYACLGAVDSQSDSEIYRRYQIVSSQDAANGPWYFEALMCIAQKRQSEQLSMWYMELLSLGTQSITSIRSELETIGLDEVSQADLSDEQLADMMLQISPRNVPAVASAAAAIRSQSSQLQRLTALGDVGVSEAFRLLGVDHGEEVFDSDFGGDAVNDTVARFKHIWEFGSSVDRVEARSALLALALSSRNPRFLNLYEGIDHNLLSQRSQVHNLDEALALLGLPPRTLNHDFSDRDLIAIFDASSEGVSEAELLELRRALKLVAESRGSAELKEFLGMDREEYTEGEEAGPIITGPRLPVGLWNTGNTCYLNSLLQFYYSLLPVREYVTSYAAPEPGATAPEKKIGGRVVPYKEIVRSESFVTQLGALFREISSATSPFVTPSELLAYMALVPPQEDADEETALHARLAGALQRQQDVTECIENVLYQLEATMTGHKSEEDGEQHDLIKDLFYGTTKQVLARVSDGGNERCKTERFSSLLLDVNNGPTPIYDSLNSYFDDELLDIEGDGLTRRTLSISRLPQILQVQVQRVQFDLKTFLPYKNLNPLIFPEIVYLDRYLDAPEGTELYNRRKAVKQWKRDIDELVVREKQVKEHAMALTTAREFCTGEFGLSEESAVAVARVHESLTAALEQAMKALEETRERVNHQFDDMTEHGYQIHSLFIHKGDASYGHYWIYIRDQETGQFYKYNDELVTAVDTDEVFDFRKQNLATPYFLVFTRF